MIEEKIDLIFEGFNMRASFEMRSIGQLLLSKGRAVNFLRKINSAPAQIGKYVK